MKNHIDWFKGYQNLNCDFELVVMAFAAAAVTSSTKSQPEPPYLLLNKVFVSFKAQTTRV